jgi:isovaleryl-CoA dehydrogenase
MLANALNRWQDARMTTYMTLDFALGENADMIRDTTQRFAADKIAPLAAKIDADDWFPRDELWTAMGELGLHGLTVGEEDGGLGLGYLEHVVAVEEVSRASASIGLSYGAHSNLCVNQVRRWGNAEQKAKYLPKLISGEHVGSGRRFRRRVDEAEGRCRPRRLCAERHKVLDN